MSQHRWTTHELVNTVTHAAGFLLALGSVPVLITLAAVNGSAREVTTFSIYSATLILMYLASTLYHAARPGRVKDILQALDHMAIYLLIAGTYTPFLLVGLGDMTGWILFYTLWGLALVGIGVKVFFTNRFDLVSTLAYLLMGWAGLAAIGPLYEKLPGPAFALVIAGGLCYTLGAVFYVWERLPHNHGIWHLFCLAGSVTQFIAVFFLLP
ncbi:MAG: hemolysin III family protein [Gammaproteobacteria bacterium]|nr:hemolysin III family protein [Gammaproteobacteria bacterium]